MSDLETRRAEAEARLRAAEAKRAARKPKQDEQAVADIEREAAEAEAIAEAESEHGDLDREIKVIRYEGPTGAGIVIVRRPPYVAVKQFHDKGKTSLEAKDKLGRPCVIYPNAAAYAALSNENVAIISAVADAAAWLAGFGRTELDSKS